MKIKKIWIIEIQEFPNVSTKKKAYVRKGDFKKGLKEIQNLMESHFIYEYEWYIIPITYHD